jgi:hypothetical protein
MKQLCRRRNVRSPSTRGRFVALQSGARIQARRGEYGAAKGYAERSLAELRVKLGFPRSGRSHQAPSVASVPGYEKPIV